MKDKSNVQNMHGGLDKINRLEEAIEVLDFVHNTKYKHITESIRDTISKLKEQEEAGCFDDGG